MSANASEKSPFRQFIIALRDHWKSFLPRVSPLTTSRGPSLPRASTFYAGITKQSNLHVFLYFQHHSKALHVGEFTLNIVLSPVRGKPGRGNASLPADRSKAPEGTYRVGSWLYRKDKWWHLLPEPPEGFIRLGKSTLVPRTIYMPGLVPSSAGKFSLSWFAPDYSNPSNAIDAAVIDVTSDVMRILHDLEL